LLEQIAAHQMKERLSGANKQGDGKRLPDVPRIRGNPPYLPQFKGQATHRLRTATA